MTKFWHDKEVRANFRRHPVRCTAIVAGCVLWYGMFLVSTLLIGGALVIAGKNDEWVSWWLP